METPSTLPSKTSARWKLYAALAVVIFGIYKLITSPALGDSIFSLIIASLLFFSEAKFVPKDFALGLRRLFKYGDKYARLCIFIIAVGGTTLTIKIAFGLSFIPDYIDFWFKRAGLPLVITAITIYLSFILSKITFYASDIEGDLHINKFEFLFYVFSIFFCVFVTFLLMGTNYMDTAIRA